MPTRFIVRRAIHLFLVAIFIMLTIFVVMRYAPGDPVDLMLRGGEGVTKEDIAGMRAELGLDQPIHVQFVRYIRGLMSGDLGTSIVLKRPVARLILERLPATVEMALGALLFSLAVGIPIGVIAAARQHSAIDRVSMGFSFLGISTPGFWLAIILIMVFSVHFKVLPSIGRIAYEAQPTRLTGLLVVDSVLTLNGAALLSALSHLILPSVTLGAHYSAIIARVLRSSMVEVLGQDYIRVANSKGLSESRVLRHHALRNALLPTVTVAGLEAGALLSGNVIIETVFAWPGIGLLIVNGIFARDYPVVQSGVIFYALLFVGINFLIDVAYSMLDPRIRWG
ncbi:MAG: ABC transporter permease [bacterium]|nr:ABC transporter permease [bacterium]